MSVRIIDMVAECAFNVADSTYHTIFRPDWLMLCNWSIRRISTRLNVYKRIWRTDMAAGVNLYRYPSNCRQMTRLQYSLTPSDARLWRDLKEIPSDEWRANTNWTYPTGDPLRYFPDMHDLYLDRIPQQTILTGLRMTGWSSPDPITTDANTVLPLKDHFRDLVMEGMEARALRKLEREDEYRDALAEFEKSIDDARTKYEQPSADRRPRMRSANSERVYEQF